MAAPDTADSADSADTAGMADTPEPPYVAVVFTSLRTQAEGGQAQDGYAAVAAEMFRLAAEQPGYLGVETAGGGGGAVGITVRYWRDEPAARAWGLVAEHLVAQRQGRDRWYADYRLRVATVTRASGHPGSGRPRSGSDPG